MGFALAYAVNFKKQNLIGKSFNILINDNEFVTAVLRYGF